MMVETTVHVRQRKIEVEIKTDKIGRFTLEPDDAVELGIKLLKAAYGARGRYAKKP